MKLRQVDLDQIQDGREEFYREERATIEAHDFREMEEDSYRFAE